MAAADYPQSVRFIQEEWPAGSAGAVRQALSEAKDGLAVIYTGNRLSSPSVQALVTEHMFKLFTHTIKYCIFQYFMV